MDSRNVQTNIITYNATVCAHERTGRCRSQNRQLHTDSIAKRRTGDWSHAEALLEHLQRLALEAEVAAPADMGDLFTSVDGRVSLRVRRKLRRK